MLRHIVMWDFADGLSQEENALNAEKIKRGLEGLKASLEGVAELRVYTSLLPQSNADIVLSGLFESQAALDAYQVSPGHISAGAFIKSVTKNRRCADYME